MTGTSADAARAAAETAAREGYGRLVAVLAGITGDLEGAQDALADAFERALRTWPADGVPQAPAAWLLTVARNRMRDRWRSAEVRRTTVLDVDTHDVVGPDDLDAVAALDPLPDRRLALLFVCAHPAIAAGMRTPLMLNAVLGFTAEQVARAWSVPTATMATRLTRVKRRIAHNRVLFEVPGRDALGPRLQSVLEAVYAAHALDVRGGTTGPVAPEAVRLAEVLAEVLPADPEVRGLAALVCLSAARAGAARDAGGRFVPLEEQDPARWDAALVARGHTHLRAAHAAGVLGRYQLEAAVQAVHCARRAGGTDWATLRPLHEALHGLAPSLGSASALAVVLARTGDPSAGLAVLDGVAAAADRFRPYWVARADVERSLGRAGAAEASLRRAVELTRDPAERAWLSGPASAAPTR